MPHPGRHAGAAHGGDPDSLGVVRYRQDARHDWRGDPGGQAAVEKPEISLGIEKELGDRAGGARIQFALQSVQIRTGVERRGMGLGIGGDRDFEIRDLAQSRHEIGGEGIAAGMRRIRRAGGGVATQGNDVTHARGPVLAGDLIDLVSCGADARQMGCRYQRGFACQPRNRGVRAGLGAAAGTVGYRHEPGGEGCQTLNAAPELLLQLVGTRWEELERQLGRRMIRRTHGQAGETGAG